MTKKNTNKKTIDDLLIDLDRMAKEEVNNFMQNPPFCDNEEDFYTCVENCITTTTKVIFEKIENLSNYKANTPLDYEKIAKIIVNTHDIVENLLSGELNKIISDDNPLNKLPPLIKKYYREYDNFLDIKDTLKTEGNYTFDGAGSFVNYTENYFSDIFVQATDAEDVLSQTDLIFKTSFITDSKKVYIISDQIPKKNLDTFFIINNSNLKEIAQLKEKLEIIRFLILSTKIFTDNFHNENTKIQYFFNIIFCSSIGFNNEYNQKIFDIFYNGKFNIPSLLFGKEKALLDSEVKEKIEDYMRSLFVYFLNKINFQYFYQDGHVSKPVSFFLSYLYGLTSFYIKNDPITVELKNKINKIKHKFTRIAECKLAETESDESHFIFKQNLDKNKIIIKNILTKRKERKINNDYSFFVAHIQKYYTEECKLAETEINESEFSFSDEEIIFFVFSDYGTGFQRLSYSFKNKSTNENEKIKYDEVKRFKKYLLFRIIEILNNLNKEHIKKLHFIFSNMKFGMSSLQSGLLQILNNLLLTGRFKRKFIDNEFIDSFKIELLSTVFYPSCLKNRNYSKLSSFILDFNSEYDCSLVHKLIIDKFNDTILLNNEITPHEFLKDFDLKNYDLSILLSNLKDNESSQLTQYINYRLNEFPLQKRFVYLLRKLDIHNIFGKFKLVEITNSEENKINLANFVKNDPTGLANTIKLKIDSLEYLCFMILEHEKPISWILTDCKQIVTFLEHASSYKIEEINNIFFKIITKD